MGTVCVETDTNADGRGLRGDRKEERERGHGNRDDMERRTVRSIFGQRRLRAMERRMEGGHGGRSKYQPASGVMKILTTPVWPCFPKP